MSETNSKRTIGVVGGGLAGMAAAAALARRGFKVTHVAPEARPDKRTSALMAPSVDIMLDNGLITDPDALGIPLSEIRIIDATSRLMRAPETLFKSAESGRKCFGWNFANTELLAAFGKSLKGHKTYKRITKPLRRMEKSGSGYTLQLEDGENLTCDLVVGADGKKSLVRAQAGIAVHEHMFKQSALVCDLELQRPVANTSIEFHYPNGPFTLVPAGDTRANLVWIDRHEVLEKARALGAEELAAEFRTRSHSLFGEVKIVTPTFVFPLGVLRAALAGQNGALLIGEAAHAFPPIGAQGLNLSLRDVADMLKCLDEVPVGAVDWGHQVSDLYGAARQGDLTQTIAMVEALFRSLLSDLLPAQTARTAGLWALKLIPPLRRKAFDIGMGFR